MYNLLLIKVLYKNAIVKFKNNERWTTYLNCNIAIKQCCPLSPTLFDIYIDKLEKCLEEAGCTGTNLRWDSYHPPT